MTPRLKVVSLLVLSLGLSPAALAVPFNIVPAAPLPTQLTPGQTATAVYTITNNTSSVRYNNTIYYLPPHVRQVLSNPNYPNVCGASFSLQPRNTPGDRCTLQLLISGPVNSLDPDPKHHLFACFPGGKTCAGTASPLNIDIVPALPVVAAAGGFFTGDNDTAPGIQTSLNNGQSWQSQNFAFLAGYTSGLLNGISCSQGSCVSVGYYSDAMDNSFPVVAMSAANGTEWTQQILSAPAGYSEGTLNGVTCSNKTCVAVGEYENNSTGNDQPFVATTNNGGATWSQQVLSLPASYVMGEMYGITCLGGTCVGAGRFTNASPENMPGIITSTNGTSWTSQVLSVTSPHTGGELYGVSCNASVCMAVGITYYNSSPYTPAYYTSTDNGASWSTEQDLTFDGFDYVSLNGVSCTSNYCVVVGDATNAPASDNPHAPAVATFSGNGTLQTATTLPILNGYIQCEFDGVYCTGNTCIASGVCGNNTTEQPLIGLGTLSNGTWNWSQFVTPFPGTSVGAFTSVG